MALTDSEIDQLNAGFETATPADIIRWAAATFAPDVAASSSFQTQSVPLLHIMAEVAPQVPIFFLDTGFHFPETLAYRDQLVANLGLNVRVLKLEIGHEGFRREYGDLHRHNPDMCCYINKVEPLRKAMRGLRAWISGIRRDQTAARSTTPIIARQSDGLYKIAPMATWTRREIWQYVHDHNLPEHPLLAQGYLSIGCAPCTRPAFGEQDERSGRWAGREKTECGLHIPLNVERPGK